MSLTALSLSSRFRLASVRARVRTLSERWLDRASAAVRSAAFQRRPPPPPELALLVGALPPGGGGAAVPVAVTTTTTTSPWWEDASESSVWFAVPKSKVTRHKKRLKTTVQRRVPLKNNIVTDPRTGEVTLQHKLPYNWKDYLVPVPPPPAKTASSTTTPKPSTTTTEP